MMTMINLKNRFWTYKRVVKLLGILLLFTSNYKVMGQPGFNPTVVYNWDTVGAQQLGWCSNYLDTLDQFLAQANSKSCIILKDGKIVHEQYYGTFTQDSVWYWASAGKTLAAFLIGLAQEQNHLSITDPTSNYLGLGWTTATASQEQQITVQDQMQMTTGLNYQVPDLDCTTPACLTYRAAAGTQWYYHNAPYLLLHDVLENATGKNLNVYTFQQLHQTIGFSGFWSGSLYLSKARAMAQFGQLLLNKGVWANQVILNDTTFLKDMLSPSQNVNPAYGYLTWLNGQATYIQPSLPFSFNGPIVANAPPDMYMAAGKNDQRIYVVPSEKLVVIRQGQAADSSRLALSGFDPNIWEILNKLRCNLNTATDNFKAPDFGLYPNPSAGTLQLGSAWSDHLKIMDVAGKTLALSRQANTLHFSANRGLYYLIDLEKGHSAKVVVY
jgi:CubicO group peptidase (beta-lactamase class C family)